MSFGIGTDPYIIPSWGNGKRLNAGEYLPLEHPRSLRVEIAKPFSPSLAPEPGLSIRDIAQAGAFCCFNRVGDDL
jgi:hypothetical protein